MKSALLLAVGLSVAGFLAGLLASPPAAALLAAAAALQLGGFVAIRRLARVMP